MNLLGNLSISEKVRKFPNYVLFNKNSLLVLLLRLTLVFPSQDVTEHFYLFQICKLTMEVGHIGVSLETTAKFVTALEVWKEQENATIHQTKQHLMASIVEDIIWWWIHACLAFIMVWFSHREWFERLQPKSFSKSFNLLKFYFKDIINP